MIDRILLILADNAAGLEARQLQAALGVEAFPRDELGTLIADGRVTLDTSSGVDVYRLGAPVAVAPKAKAVPTSRMVPIALLDALALAVNVPLGTPLVDMCHAIEAERAIGIANHRALQARADAAAAIGVRWQEVSEDGLLIASLPSAQSTSPTLPDGWSAYYACGKARVCGQPGGGWCWTVDEAGPNGSGGLASDLSLAFARADAVRVLS